MNNKKTFTNNIFKGWLQLLPGLGLATIFPLTTSIIAKHYGYISEIIIFDLGIFATLLTPATSNLLAFLIISFIGTLIFLLSLLNGSFSISPQDLFYLAEHGGILEYKNLPAFTLIAASIFLLLIIAKHKIHSRLPQNKLHLSIALIAILAIDQTTTTQKAYGVNLLYLGQMQLFKTASNREVYVRESQSYKKAKIELEKGNRVLLITIESMGYPKNPSILETIINAAQKTKSIKVTTTKEEAIGPTIQGELRILCGLSGKKASNLSKSIESIPQLNCLPKLPKTSTGIHGNVGIFYGRNLLYPSIGFKKTSFKENLTNLETGCTTAYEAVCDGAVYREINKISDQFVYFMTIDNHHPYKSRNAIAPDCQHLEEKYWMQICSNLINLVNEVEVEKFDTILITGDHPPPQVPSAENKLVPLFQITNTKSFFQNTHYNNHKH